MKVTNPISEKHQILEDRVLLTVGKIYNISSSSFDFGGSEYGEAKLDKIPIVKKDIEDKYGWWNLPAGYYVMEFNESIWLPKGKTGILQPWSERFPASATHSARILKGKNDKVRVVLTVSKAGIKIKENARFSELIEL